MDNRFLCRGMRLGSNGEIAKEWITGYYAYHEPPLQCCKVVGNEEKGQHVIIKTGFADWNMPRPLECYPVDKSTVGRCTGLSAAKSYRGERPEDLLIYEGDILEAPFISDPSKKSRIKIGYGNFKDESHLRRYEYLGFYISSMDKFDKGDTVTIYNGYAIEKFEIIGNIYENPE